jgi:hypothetical protein
MQSPAGGRDVSDHSRAIIAVRDANLGANDGLIVTAVQKVSLSKYLDSLV